VTGDNYKLLAIGISMLDKPADLSIDISASSNWRKRLGQDAVCILLSAGRDKQTLGTRRNYVWMDIDMLSRFNVNHYMSEVLQGTHC
jgi:hypothetical protein